MSPTVLGRGAGGGRRRLALLRRRYLSYAAPISLALALLVGATAMIVESRSADSASAAEIPGAITNVSIAETSTGYWDSFRVDIAWSVPDSATEGDTFYFNLPPQVQPQTSGFDLRDPQGRLVAVATISNGVATFTLTDYADTFSAVSGTAFFAAIWNGVDAGGGPVDVEFVTSTQTFTDTVNVDPRPPTQPVDRTIGRKSGWFNDGTDQGRTNPTNAIHWFIETRSGPAASIQLHDAPSAGHVIECGTLRVDLIGGFDAMGENTTAVQVNPITTNCTPTSLDLDLGSLQADQAFRIQYDTTITSQTAGTYTNGATLTYDGQPVDHVQTVRRSSAGGDGSGYTEPHVDVEKFATSLGATAGDADLAPGVELDGAVETPVSVVVTNDGNEALVDLTVSDSTGSGVALSGLSCDFSALGGPASGVVWAGPFAVGASFTCTGTLPAMGDGAVHANTASVTATSQTTNVPVTAEDPFNSTTPAPPAVVSVGDFVWVDSNGDGIQDSGEPGIAGVELTLTGPDGNPVTDVNGNVVGPTSTDGSGFYNFGDLPVLAAGESYTVTINAASPALAGYQATTANVGDPALDSSTGSASSGDLVNDGDSDPTLDFGFVLIPPAVVSVGDFVWLDTNQDGIQDAGEPGIADVNLTLTGPDGNPVTDVNGNPVGPVTTNGSGFYNFGDLPVLAPGETYTVTIDSNSPGLVGYAPTTANVGDPALDSSTGSASSGDLVNDGDSDLTLDFGFVPVVVVEPSVSVGDFVWIDIDGDGTQDTAEPGIAGVELTLTGPDGNPVTDVNGNPVGPTVTDGSGFYSFGDLPVLAAGESYTVTINAASPALVGYTPTTANVGDPATDSSTGSASSGDLVNDGDSDPTLDFGFVPVPTVDPSVSVGDFVWIDIDGDGTQDTAEPGLGGVSLILTGPGGAAVTDVNGNPVGPTTTASDGSYSFDDLPVLPAGESYTVTIDTTSPALVGYTPTTANVGDPATDSSTGSASSGDLVNDGDSDPTLDFGFVPVPTGAVSVGDFVWLDTNKDGIQDSGEPGIGGVNLTLTGPDGLAVTDVNGNPVGPTTTASDGSYSFDDLPVLPAGESYTVTIDELSPALAPYVPTISGVGDPATDSSNGSASSGDLTNDGDSDPTLDFGFVPAPVNPPASVSVGDFVWVDTNGDGIQDPGEPGIAGVTLNITGPDGNPVTDVNGNPVGPEITDADGAYNFDNLPVLPPGEHYTVTIDTTSPALAPYVPTTAGVGDPATDSSTGTAESGDLVNDGDSDDTLDFGFVPKPVFDLALRKTTSAKTVAPGDMVPFTITVFNQGTIAATNVVVTDTPPAGMSFNAGDNPDWSLVGGVPTTTIAGPIAPGESVAVTLTLEVTATDASARLVNQAEISDAQGPDGEDVTDVDSTPNTDPTDDQLIDDETDLTPETGDEDDHDIAAVGMFDLALRKTTDRTTIKQGDLVPFTITVFNQGTLAATNVTVADHIPDGLTFVQLANPGWDLVGNVATSTFAGPLAPGEQVELGIQLLVSGTQDELVNLAEITEAHDPDGNPVEDIDSTPDGDPNNDTLVDDVIDGTDGDEDDHDVAVIHPEAPPTSTTTTVADTTTTTPDTTVPGTSTTTPDTTVPGTSTTTPDTTVPGTSTTTPDTTVPGTSTTTPDTTVPGTSTTTPDTTVPGTSTTTPDTTVPGTSTTTPDTTVPGSTTTTTVPAADVFDLAIRKTSNVKSAVTGDMVPFTITVFNQGTIAATNVVVTDTPPAGMSFNAGDNPDWSLVGGVPTTTIAGPIAPGESVAVTLTLEVTATNASAALVNNVEISDAKGPDGEDVTDVDSTPDDDPTNDELTDDEVNETPETGDEDDHDVAVIGLFDLALRKTTDQTTIKQGDLVPFTITVFNQGTVAATNVTIADHLPDGLTFVQLANPGWTLVDGVATSTFAGPLAPGEQVELGIQLLVSGTQDELVNLAEITEAHDPDGNPVEDIDSTPDDDPNNDHLVDDVIDGTDGDEDDHDVAIIHPETPSTTTTTTTPATTVPGSTTTTPATTTTVPASTTTTPATTVPATTTPNTTVPATTTPNTTVPGTIIIGTTTVPGTTTTPGTTAPVTTAPVTTMPDTITVPVNPGGPEPTAPANTDDGVPSDAQNNSTDQVPSDAQDNNLNRTPTGTSPNTGNRTNSLPRTGFDPGVLIGLGIALLGSGAAIMGARRRRITN